MGFLLQSQGKLSEAEPYHREALDGRRRVLGNNHPDTLISTGSMDFLLRLQDKLSGAEPYYQEALQGSRRVLGDLAVGAMGDDDGGYQRGAVWVLFLDGVGGDACQYKLKRDSKPKGGCRARLCPVKGDIIASKENCERKKDCEKKLKGKIPCPDG